MCVLLVCHVILFDESQDARVSGEENALAAGLELQQRMRASGFPYLCMCMYVCEGNQAYVCMYVCMYVYVYVICTREGSPPLKMGTPSKDISTYLAPGHKWMWSKCMYGRSE